MEKIIKLFSEPKIKEKNGREIIEGEVIACDAFGNIITNIKEEQIRKLADFGSEISLQLGERELKLRFLKSYGYAEKGELLCLINSAKHFEIACREGNAGELLKVKGGERIIISFEK